MEYRQLLGVSRSSTDREIRKAFLQKYGDPWHLGDEKYRNRLVTAYELLQCADARACLAAWSGGTEVALLQWMRERCRFDAFAVLCTRPEATLCQVASAFDALRPCNGRQQLALELGTCFHVDRYRQWLVQGYIATTHSAVPVRLALTLENAMLSVGLLPDLTLRKAR
jgi:hypothetical protein